MKGPEHPGSRQVAVPTQPGSLKVEHEYETLRCLGLSGCARCFIVAGSLGAAEHRLELFPLIDS